ncbi:MAG: hypothetical protein Q4G51_17685 [Dermatophilus congolensis]|nr:hypothetical protein [Dermatophilus congolensis]
MPPSDASVLGPAGLARGIVASLAPRLAGVPGWSERELVGRVSPRPVEGIAVWRIPVAAPLASATGDDPAAWAARVRDAAGTLPGVDSAWLHGGAVDVRLSEPMAALPLTAHDCRLWHGASGEVRVRSAPVPLPNETHYDQGRHLRASVLADAIVALATAAGDTATRVTEPEPGGHDAAGPDTFGRTERTERTEPTDRIGRISVDGPVVSRDIKVGPVRFVAGESAADPVAVGAPSTPVRAALLAAAPNASIDLDHRALLARVPANAGFLLVHTALALRASPARDEGPGLARMPGGGPDSGAPASVRDDGREPLLVALASYPFVVEKGVVGADPGVVLRHLLTVAGRSVALCGGGDEADALLRQSAATVLVHGIEALGMRLPTRI